VLTSKFDVLLTDISLPGVSGSELAVQAVALAPSLKVIFATGYDQVRGYEATAVLLRKPFTEEHLAVALRNAIGL